MRHGLLSDSLPDHALIAGSTNLHSWPTLLVVDSDTEMLSTLACFFEKRGFHVAAATNLADAKAFCHRRLNWTLVIADYHLPDGTGWELCCWLREQPNTPVGPFLLMSGSMSCAGLSSEVDYLPKPFHLDELETRVRALLHQQGGAA